jgi:hypothetical protein
MTHWRLEAWNPDYALPQVGLEESDPTSEVNTELETPWQPIAAGPQDWPVLYFVDGRQRVDAVLANPQGRRALLVTVVVGALVRDDGGIRMAGLPWVRRFALHTGELDQEIEVGSFVYKPVTVQARDLRDMVKQINTVMRRLEGELAATLEGGLVIGDGPIFATAHTPPHMIGYAKTMWQRYLPTEKETLLHQLKPAQRTPIFFIPASGRRTLDLISWYMRLPLTPASPFHAGAGLIRVETPACPTPQAIARANLSLDLLCSLASSPSRDPRAPQNLIPIGGLEMLLGRYMGQAEVVRRRIVAGLFS